MMLDTSLIIFLTMIADPHDADPVHYEVEGGRDFDEEQEEQ